MPQLQKSLRPKNRRQKNAAPNQNLPRHPVEAKLPEYLIPLKKHSSVNRRVLWGVGL